MKKKSLLAVLSIILVVISLLATGCTKQKVYQTLCFEQGGLIDKEGKCILPTQQVEQSQPSKPVQEQQVEQSQPAVVFNQTFIVDGEASTTNENPPQEEEEIPPTDVSIPVMEWTNGKESRSYQVYDAGTHLEWWMDGYNHLDAGEITLEIGDFREISYNSISDGEGYIIEILDEKGESVYTFQQHANLYNDGIWFPVQTGWKTIHITYPNPNNESNGCVIFARP